MSDETDRLLRDAMNVQAFLHKLAMIKIEADHRRALYLAHHKPPQPAAPAANPRNEAKTEGAAARAGDGDPKPAAGAEPGK